MMVYKNPFIDKINNLKQSITENSFGEAFRPYALLSKYSINSPHKFYRNELMYEILEYIMSFYESNQEEFANYIVEHEREISLSNSVLEEINELVFHDEHWIDDDYKLLSFIDKSIHPNLIKLYEGSYKNLIHLLAFISRSNRGKGPEGLDLYNSVGEINGNSNISTKIPYKNILRNGIAHGDYQFRDHQIVYRDKKGNILKLSPKDVVREFDTTLDFCNTLMLSLKLFLLPTIEMGFKIESFAIEEMKSRVQSKEWKILNIFRSTVRNGEKQINIHIENAYYDWNKVQINAVYTALSAEKYLFPLDRIYLTLDSKFSDFVGFTAFNGHHIANLRLNNYVFSNGMKTIMEDKLLFFVSKYKLPKIMYYLGTLNLAIKNKVELDEIERKYLIPFEVRKLKYHSKKQYNVIQQCSIVIFEPNPVKYIQDNIEKIVKAVKNKRSKDLPIFSFSRLKRTKYIRLYFYDTDSRRRTMDRNMRDGLIGILHYNSSKIIKDYSPKGVEEVIKKYKVFWQ
jgi:hypothetical protein